MKGTRLAFVLVAGALLAACGDISEYPEKACTTAGTPGCPCAPRDTCLPGSDGIPLACVDGICRAPECQPGTPGGTGCLCGDLPCAEGHVCVGGRCEVDTGQTLVPPAEPSCYTPCRGDLDRNGTRIVCERDGLLPGCIDGAECIDGTCVSPRAAPSDDSSLRQGLSASACTTDADCPSFQACIAGACYSDCVADADCRGDRVCYRRACRLPCDTATATCPAGTSCASVDGRSGVCLPVARAAAVRVPPFAGSFRVSVRDLALNSLVDEASFDLSNDGSEPLELRVRKVRHREFTEDGPKSITTDPLHWLGMSVGGAEPERVAELSVPLAPGESATVHLAGPDNPTLDRWDGWLEVSHPEAGIREVYLSWNRSPEGQWSGTLYYLANFPESGLESWLRNRDDRAALRGVGNAFIRRWGALRDARISLKEFMAALNAMYTESWKWDSVRQRCPSEDAPDENVGCYLYDNNEGIAIFSDYLPEVPIPSGVAEFPVAINLRARPAGTSAEWTGKFVSAETLHYAGDPEVSLVFAHDPITCESGTDACITLIRDFKAQVLVGGRYLTGPTDTTCSRAAAGTFEAVRIPWLVPGFEAGTSADATTGRLYRHECRDKLLPFGPSQELAARNLAMAASNPIPDGATRRRMIELVDGALIDQSTLFIIFRERLPSFLDPEDQQGFSAYGLMLLTRSDVALEEEDFRGSNPQDFRPPPAPAGTACSDELVQTILAPLGGGVLDDSTASAVAIGVVSGVVPSDDPPAAIDAGSPEKVHYLCHDTGLFDGGPKDDGSAEATRVACPEGSKVEYFTLQGNLATQASIAAQACQNGGGICLAGEPCAQEGCTVGQPCAKKGSCVDQLRRWEEAGTASIRLDPIWRCTEPGRVYCDLDRGDLRSGKTFYRQEAQEAVFRSLDDEIEEAFRYKTRFRNRTGRSVGFAPEVCQGDSIPYCYDPAAIEAIRERIDCAIHVYTDRYNALDDEARRTLKAFLVRNFAYAEERIYGLATPLVIDGFERLYSELLIMMGDESFTSAFSSRFDLAGQKLADFQGSLLEPNGIDLSGGAGFEMYSLYQATQYYQLTLDRFYAQAPAIWASLGKLPPGQGFITQATTTSYFDRLIRASSQKARAFSEIAKRYQGFDRPDLARLVIERAYAQSYLESLVLSQLMRRVGEGADAAARAQITRSVELAQLTYRAALLDMRNVYQDITDEVTFYGIPPDYIPFPALDEYDGNAFEKVMARARELAAVAAEKEERALADTREFDTDSALFQAELARIRDEAESTLAEICGTFRVEEDGTQVIFPAIPKYAHLTEYTRLLGDPCGLVGNGQLYDAVATLEQIRLQFDQLRLRQRNLEEAIADAQAQVDEQCKRLDSYKEYVIEMGTEKWRLMDAVNSLGVINDTIDDTLNVLSNLVEVQKCSPVTGECATSAIGAVAWTIAGSVGGGIKLANNIAITGMQSRINYIDKQMPEREIEEECEAAKIDTKYTVKEFMRQAAELGLEGLQLQYDLSLQLSAITALRNQAIAEIAQQEENEQLAINIEAARNDPNIRIYRNDAVAAADRTFHAALKEAYRATRVFEYYTSQSWAARSELFLVRMVANGDFPLEAYLDELEDAFVEFEETYGNPDLRVAVVSLRDDVLRIPRLDENGVALSEVERTRLFRERLADPALLDDRGYRSMSFSTSVNSLSPLTRNHKVRWIEAELVGDGLGDALGRLYVSQRGTGVIRALDGSYAYYSFPERTAVLNPFMNGVRDLAEDVYRSERLRDRPFANTEWTLVFNQKDEEVNLDIDLAALSDVRLYLYYTDFTEI